MKWCETCKTEYEEYVEKCNDCGTTLVSDAEYIQTLNKVNPTHTHEALNLTVVYESTLESEILLVSEMLKENGIFSEIKNEGIGSYLQIYSGVNYLGTFICVNEEDAEAAKALIENLWGDVERDVSLADDLNLTYEDEEATEMEAYRSDYNKSLNLKKNMLKVFILLIFGSVLVIEVISILK